MYDSDDEELANIYNTFGVGFKQYLIMLDIAEVFTSWCVHQADSSTCWTRKWFVWMFAGKKL